MTQTRNICLQLFIVSFIVLFLELMLIRWVPSNVRVIAYYANLMLISSFLGIGLGALLKGRGLNLFKFFPYILLSDIIFLIICRKLAVVVPVFSGEYRPWAVDVNVISIFAVIGIFLFNTTLFVPLGEKIGQLFDSLPPLRAYSWDLCGSLVGTIAFGCFSFMFFSPFFGFLIVTGLFFLLLPSRSKLAASVLLISLGCVYFVTPRNAIWSPYYYITIFKYFARSRMLSLDDAPENIRTMTNPPRFKVLVNSDFYQPHGTVNIERYNKDSKKWHRDYVNETFLFHTLPFRINPSCEKVLVLGAGGGTDIEAALMLGSKQVDAVEIDPVIIKISKAMNSNGIYFDPRVHLEIDDARAFLAKTETVYDHVIYTYLDATALFSSMSSIRLDGYVYTVESFRASYKRVKEGGLLSVTFAIGTPWIQERLVWMMYKATGKIPIVYTRPVDGEFPTTGPIAIIAPKGDFNIPTTDWQYKRVNLPQSFFETEKKDLPTDDWPFLYLKEKNIPNDYLIVIVGLIVISTLILARASRLRWGMEQTHFFFLGAGFLLLETKSITSCSLYFGATWFITTLVITGILLMVLLANLLAMRLRSFHRYFYLPLILSMILLYLTPNDLILSYPFWVRLLWVILFVPLPVFFAGLIFSTTFRETKSASSSFGANLIGATIGGFLEYSSMAVGFNNVTLLVMAAYLASLFMMVWIKGRV